MTRGIKINSADGYLHMNDLPHNCIFNKVVTGCGGTTITLQNDEDYIIAVPTTELIINKIGRPDAGIGTVKFHDGTSRKVFGLHGRYNIGIERDLMEYVANSDTKKIICTYDKLPKLCELINPKRFRLLVDEYHRLLKDYSYRERATVNTTYTSDTGKSYDFNTATKLNSLLVKVLKNTGQLVAGESYDLDFDHQFIETEKYDAKMTYKKFTGYSPGVAVIGDLIVGIENRDGNANVRFHQQDTLERIYSNLESEDIHIKRSRMDCGSCSREIVETVEKHSELFYIRANRCGSLYNSLLALRGWQSEEINGIGYELNSIIVEKWEGKAYRLVIQRERRLDGEQDLWEGEYTYRCILTNDYTSTNREIVEFYNPDKTNQKFQCE